MLETTRGRLGSPPSCTRGHSTGVTASSAENLLGRCVTRRGAQLSPACPLTP